MDTDRRRRLALRVCLVLFIALVCAPLRARASTGWWEPLALAGERVSSVTVEGDGLHVTVGEARLVSRDGGHTFTASPPPPAGTAVSPPTGVRSGGVTWVISGGVVMSGPSSAALHPDPGAPFLGVSSHLIAAPAATPGVVVAVGSDNHVWRRAQSGSWATSFVLLPGGGLDGTPRVTALAAFTEPLSAAVYLGVDGYGVLVTSNGGDDWIHADPGLPENLLGLATDAVARVLYAATDSGLFVHHLQSFPAPPSYQDAALWWRWAGIVAVSVVATAAAVLALRRVTSGPQP